MNAQDETCVEEQLPLAGPSDQVHVQRATTRCIVPIRTLGQGAFAQVDLCHIPAGPSKKLLVRKLLIPESTDGQVQALKPSSTSDWNREATMHRECEGCPFVLQLLAAKRCRSGKLLLLLEYAAMGSLTDILTARRQQVQQQQQLQVMPLIEGGTCLSGALAAAQGTGRIAENDIVDALLPFAMSAVSLLKEEDTADDQIKQKATGTVGITNMGHTQQSEACKQQLQHSYGCDEDESPVFVTFMPALLAEAEAADAALQQQPQQHAALHIAAATKPASTAELNTACTELLATAHHGLPEASAKFFAGCILMALQWMHSKRMLHRDIKPCNLLLCGDGYLKLADLGCCCQLPPGVEAAQTRTGTAAYMAPEVLGQTPYSYPVDLWSLGVTIWQMVAGCLPDWAEKRQDKQQLQLQPEWWDGHPEPPEPLLFPTHFSQELCCLLSGLLHHDSAARLKLDDVMAADWFAGFDWQGLRDKTLTPPSVL